MHVCVVCVFLFFHIFSILNIKTCSFHCHFPSVFMPAKKKNKTLHLFQFPPLKMLLFDSFKNTSVCTNTMKKIEQFWWKKRNSSTTEHQHAWLNPNVICNHCLTFLPPFVVSWWVCLLSPWIRFSSRGLQAQIHTQHIQFYSPRMTSSCALLFSVSSLSCFFQAI